MSDEIATTPWAAASLISAERSGAQFEFVLFWGHTPRRDEKLGPHVFSQWFDQAFAHEGVTYRTAEHFMMAAKARLFENHELVDAILAAVSPRQAKALGRLVQGFSEEIWTQQRMQIVTAASIAKFGSSDEMRDYLIGTGDAVLVEASPDDAIWGIGLSKSDPRARHPSQWLGLNLLGFALMNARTQLKGQAQSASD